jgi:hypothetical protein
VEINEDSDAAIRKACDYILNNSAGDIYINVSDGLATINTIMTMYLIDKGVKFISYDIFDNEYHVIGKNGILFGKKAKSMDIRSHFMLKGSEVLTCEPFDYALDNENVILELFENHFDEFNLFKKKFAQNDVNFEDFPNVSAILKKLGYELDCKSLVSHKKAITGSLFEMYVYLKAKNLGFDDLMMGAIIDINGIKNEFDLLVMKNNHLNIIECKFKSIVRDLDKLIYKYALLREVLDYDSKALIISDDEILGNYKLRAKYYNVGFVNAKSRLDEKIKDFLSEN